MKKEDFIDKHYYKCILSNSKEYYYFKYCNKNPDNNIFYNENKLYYYYEICIAKNIFYKIGNTNTPYTIEIGYKYEEVDFSEIVNYLPNDNPDKVIYLRKQRINKLLWL